MRHLVAYIAGFSMAAVLIVSVMAVSLNATAQAPTPPTPPPTLPSGSQEGPVMVPLVANERKFLLDMCEAAAWASRIVFSPACDQLKAKFLEAETKAKAAAATPATPEKSPAEAKK